jgi:hypothetical protein
MNVMIISGDKTIIENLHLKPGRRIRNAKNIDGVSRDALGIYYSFNYCSTYYTLSRGPNLAHEYTGIIWQPEQRIPAEQTKKR